MQFFAFVPRKHPVNCDRNFPIDLFFEKMLSRLYHFICFLLIHGIAMNSFSQGLVEVKAKLNGQAFSYFVMDPGNNVKGILLLFPGKGESAESVFNKTPLPYELSREGFMTIVPGLPYSLIADEFTRKAINQILISQISKHKNVKPNLVLGGFSAGGTLAISLAEYYFKTDSNSTVRGVFAIDPPLDFTRLYASAENKVRYNCQSLVRKEGKMMIEYFNETVGGPPNSKSEEYLKLSPFSANDPDGGNAKYLENIPVRLYAEPDLDFVKKFYCKELQFSDLNAFDLEKLNKILFVNGNSTCEYITTRGKGYHSWNILDTGDAVEWIKRICVSSVKYEEVIAEKH